MNIDVQTLALASGIASLIEVAVLFFQYRLARNHPGPGWWTLGMASITVAAAASLLRDQPTVGPFTNVASLALYVTGLSLLYVGVLRFLSRRERRSWLVGYCASAVAIVAYFSFVQRSLTAYMLIVSVSVVLLACLGARALLGPATRGFAESARMLAAALLAFGVYHAARIPIFLVNGLPGADPFSPQPVLIVTQVATLIIVMLVTFAFVLMVKQRLSAEIAESRDRLDRAQRAEVVARLAGGVAHNFNNQLTTINGFAELLAGSFGEDDPRRADANRILEAGSRAAAVTGQLLAFGRRQTQSPAILEVDAVVVGLTSMLASFAGDDVEVAVRPGAPGGLPLVDPSQLEEIVVALAFNARDAMPAGGQMTVGTARVSIGPGELRLSPRAAPGDYIRVTVADTGTGIPADVLPHVFEPFFSTRAVGWGPDLGLSSIDGLVAQADGFTAVASEMGGGSAFSVYLPVAAGGSGA